MKNNNNSNNSKDAEAESFKCGNTTIRICDDYCIGKTRGDIEAILSRIAMRAQIHLTAQTNTETGEK